MRYKREEKAKVVIGIGVEDVLRIVALYADAQARALKEEPSEWKAMLQDVVEEDNIAMVELWMELGLGELSGLVAGYEKKSVSRVDMHSTDSVGGKEAYRAVLTVPPTLPESTVQHVVREMMQYLACKVMEEMTSLVLPELAPTWQVKKQMVADAISSAMKERTEYIPVRWNPW